MKNHLFALTLLVAASALTAAPNAGAQGVTQNGITLNVTDVLYPHLVQPNEPFSILVDFSANNGQPLFFRWFKDNSDASLSGNRTGANFTPLDEFSNLLSIGSFQPSDTGDYYLAASFLPVTDLFSALTSGQSMFTNSIGALTPDFLATADPTWSAYLEGNAPAPALYGAVPEPSAALLALGGFVTLAARRRRA